jgi:hypothetical protein
MTLTATIAIDVNATKAVTSGLTSAIDQHPLRFSVDAGDCTKVWSDRRTVGAFGYDDIDFSAAGISTVKVLFVKNLAATDIALSAGWGGSDFRNFIVDSLAWNFSPMVNLGSLSLRGMPIRADRTWCHALTQAASRRCRVGAFSASAGRTVPHTKSTS